MRFKVVLINLYLSAESTAATNETDDNNHHKDISRSEFVKRLAISVVSALPFMAAELASHVSASIIT
jgi:hypothetical protein